MQRDEEAISGALGQITRYTWCGCGSLESLTDALGQLTTFSHDVQGRTTAKRYADGQEGLDYQYENTTSRLKTRSDALGQQTRYRYAKDNAPLEIAYANAVNPTPTRHFQYDAVYPCLSAFDQGQGVTTLSYQPAGQPGAGRRAGEASPDAFAIAYGYDSLGRPQTTSVVKPDNTGLPATLSYDALGRITRNDTDLGAFQYAYEADSQRLQQIGYPNNTQPRFAYFDTLGDFRLKSLNHLDPAANLLAGNSYSYDAMGQITGWQRTGTETAQEGFVYDAIGQLLRVTDGNIDGHPRAIPAVPGGEDPAATPAIPPQPNHGDGSAYAYAYDAAGNRIAETLGGQTAQASYNSLNQLLSDGADSYVHDADGNITERQSASLGNRRTFWDADNRLIAIEDAANPAKRSDFQYDALGRRIAIQDSDNGVVTQDSRLIYCGTTLCAKQDKLTGAVTRYYPDGESRVGTGIYYHRDHLGSVRAATDAAGTLKAAYAYDPYGRRTALTGATGDVDFGYTGHFVHHKSGLALAPYRAYDAEIGRWMSPDPIGEPSEINLYAYVGNNPLRYTDMFGLSIDCEWITIEY